VVEAGGAGAKAAAAAASKLEEREGCVLAAGFVAAQARGALQPAVLEDTVSRLAALLPSFERQPMLAGAAALALGYIGASGQLPDVLAPAQAQAALPTGAEAGDGARASGGAVLVRLAALLPTTAPIGAGREGGQAAAAALCRVAQALGLGMLGEDRPEVLRAVVKGGLGPGSKG
jgi:hypothetical protein